MATKLASHIWDKFFSWHSQLLLSFSWSCACMVGKRIWPTVQFISQHYICLAFDSHMCIICHSFRAASPVLPVHGPPRAPSLGLRLLAVTSLGWKHTSPILLTRDFKSAQLPALHWDIPMKPDYLCFAFFQRTLTSVLPVLISYHPAPNILKVKSLQREHIKTIKDLTCMLESLPEVTSNSNLELW